MKAGRELDALVAEKVMKIECYLENPQRCPHCKSQVPNSYWHFNNRTPKWTCLSGHFLRETPDYSTSIADTWLVVEKMEASHEFEFFKVEHMRDKYDWFWQARFGSCEPAEADTAPLAICLAALKAVGVEI